MKVALLLLALACVCLSEAAVSLTEQLENPEHPRQCYERSTRTWYTVGAKWQPPGECVQNTCNQGSKKGMMSIRGVSCGHVGALPNPNCHLSPANPARVYPDCCPQPVCPK